MSEDKKSEENPTKNNWVIPIARGIDISNITLAKMQEISKKKNFSFTIPKAGENIADIDEMIIVGVDTPTENKKKTS